MAETSVDAGLDLSDRETERGTLSSGPSFNS